MDNFVIGLAALLGLALASAAVFDLQQAYQLRTARWIESRWGHTAARAYYALMAVLLWAMAVMLWRGWTPLG